MIRRLSERHFFRKMHTVNRETIIGVLKPYFERRDDVRMAFLFGSQASGAQCGESDVDLAVYFTPKSGRLECEETDIRYEEGAEVWREVEAALGREVDLVMLNRAAASIAASAISGVPIVIKDRGLYLDFMLRVTAEAEDFRQFVREYWRLKEEMRAHAGRA
jgi:predicted nucleotidyltransferase